MAALLKVILGDNNSQRLTFPDGLPTSVSELVDIVQRQCAIQTNFRLQFMDPLFNNEFMNLTSMDEVTDRGTIRVIYMTGILTPQRVEVQISSGSACNYSFLEESSSVSSGGVDTDILSSPESDASTSSTSRTFWPSTFSVPQFGFDAELKLERGNAAFKENGVVLIPDLKLKSNILEGLIQEIVKYKVYVTDREFDMVGEALLSKHPCLTERGSVTGYAGWKASLKNKLAIYRTHLRKLGCPEVLVNSVKHKPEGKSSAASAIKRPRRSEVNYCPPYPTGESDQSLEGLRVELLSDVKKRNNREAVRRKMDQTFAHRRYEVVRDKPMVEDFKNRWPALFDVTEVRHTLIYTASQQNCPLWPIARCKKND
uniref:PB1 domain-containing protein n=1 Tax=Acanthochromis polyacanthus TaxID=80966 RepID=A0A3Q1GF00_9TELE